MSELWKSRHWRTPDQSESVKLYFRRSLTYFLHLKSPKRLDFGTPRYILWSKRCVYSIMDVSLLTFYWIKRKVSSNLLCSKSSNSTNRAHVIYVISLTSRKLVIFDAFQSLVRLTYFSMSTSSSTPSWINFLSKICFLEFLSGIGISIFINRSEIIKIKKSIWTTSEEKFTKLYT